jgi:hypothetical protein
LRGKLAPAPAPDAKVVTRLIADFDSDDFAARDKATAALEKLAALMMPQLRAALAKPASLDLERRAEKILERVASQPLRAEELRDLRAVETLEYIATPGARVVLEAVAAGAAGAPVTRDAQAALLRWSRSTASR